MARDPNIDKAKALWDESGGTITNKEIAQRLGIENERKVGAWKSRYDWEGKKSGGVVQQKKKRCTTKKKSVVQQNTTVDVDLDKAMLTSVEANEELTDKQRAFCLHYAKTFNAFASAIKAGYSSDSAYVIGCENLTKPYIREEITRLKEMRNLASLRDASDVVELHMRIAFADISDYVSFGQEEIPVMSLFGPMEDEDGNALTKIVNTVRFKEDSDVDGQILAEVKQGKDGASVKLVDRHKSLAFLERYFELNPMDRHKKEYDIGKLELEREKAHKDDAGNKRTFIVDDLPEDDNE